MIRVGLIGAGFIGRNHFNQYEKMGSRAGVVALCDPDADRRAGDWSKVGGNLADAQGTKRDLGAIRPYVNWQDIVADPEVDMVDICCPTILHRDITVAAAKAGKHVLCEKPMALSVEQCDQMIAACRAAGRRLMVAQVVRFWPEYMYVKQAVESTRFGPLRALHLRRQTSVPSYSLNNWIVNPELSGGAVVDLHVHDVDFALHLLGKPQRLFAQGYQRTGGGVDRIHALWHYRPELVVQLEGFWDVHPGLPFNMGVTAVFEDATILYDSASDKPLTVLRREGEPEHPTLSTVEGYFAEIEHFLGAIEAGREPTISTPQESRDAVAIALAEKRSALTGESVTID